MTYAVVDRAVSGRPVDQDGSFDFVNRELLPLLQQMRAAINGIGNDLNTVHFSIGSGVPATVVTGVGIYVRTDAVSASTVLYVSQAGVWTPVTVP